MAGSVIEQTTIDAAEDYLLVLASKIFVARDLNSVEEEIYKASKIIIGLDALNQSSTETDATAREQIILGLHVICGVYNQQTIPLVSI